MNDYEAKKQARIDRYRDKADKARAESHNLYKRSSDMLSAIPPGQPLLVDHYSYKSDKRYRDSAARKMDQSMEAMDKAAYGGVFGTFFVVGLGEEDFVSLTPEQVKRYKEKFHQAEILLGVDGNDLITMRVEPKKKSVDPPHRGPKAPER